VGKVWTPKQAVQVFMLYVPGQVTIAKTVMVLTSSTANTRDNKTRNLFMRIWCHKYRLMETIPGRAKILHS
jgi:hypothetical protein